MNDVEPNFPHQLNTVFAQLTPQSVEEFYATYQQWQLQQRIIELRQRLQAVREQQAHIQQRLQETRPSAVALAALARLQSNGVSDLALLDAMLERGENWLDQTMQRLDYFEQFDDFIGDDYTKWCQGALEGAFDWIDTLRESATQGASTQLETPPAEQPPNDEDAGNVEALLLQRLASEDEQDDLSWQEATTFKQPAIKAPPSPIITPGSPAQEPPAPDSAAPQSPFIVEAGVDVEEGGDPRGRLRPSNATDLVEAGVDAEEGGDPRGRLPIPLMPEIAIHDPTISASESVPTMPEIAVEDSTVSVPINPPQSSLPPAKHPLPKRVSFTPTMKRLP